MSASERGVRALAADIAVDDEGMGKGEFAAWLNNLRAMAVAVGGVAYGLILRSSVGAVAGASSAKAFRRFCAGVLL